MVFTIHCAIEEKLKVTGLDLSATQALIALKTVRVVDINLGGDAAKRSVTRGTHRAAAVLRALGITDLDPPSTTARPKRGVVTNRQSHPSKINGLQID